MRNVDVGGEGRGTAVAPDAGSGASVDPSERITTDPPDDDGRCDCYAEIGFGDHHGPCVRTAGHDGWCQPCACPSQPCEHHDDGKREARAAQLGLLIDGAPVAPERSSAQSQWHTPRKLADRLLSLVSVAPFCLPSENFRHDRLVLDLGGGGGALTDAALRAGASNVVVVERDSDWCAFLRERYRREDRVRVVEADVDELAALSSREACKVLGTLAPADVVLSNPPFEGGGFVRFALAAIALSKQGAPCAFIGPLSALPMGSPAQLQRGPRPLTLWSSAEMSDLAICAQRPRFGGDRDIGAQTDFIAVRFSGEPTVSETHHGARVHFWTESWS